MDVPLQKKKKFIKENFKNVDSCHKEIFELLVNNGCAGYIKEVASGSMVDLDKLEEKILNPIYNILKQHI